MFTITAELVIDGAVAESCNFETETEYQGWLQGVKDDAHNWDDHVPYAVYRVDHHHAEDIGDCTCAQYILAHVPEWQRPVADSELPQFRTARELNVNDEVVLHGRVVTIGYSLVHRMSEVVCELENGELAAFWVSPEEPWQLF